MEFDDDGMYSSESFEMLAQLEREDLKSAETYKHNMSVEDIVLLGEQILDFCLQEVASNRKLLMQEGALNIAILQFLENNGYEYTKGTTNTFDAIHTKNEDGFEIITLVNRERESPEIFSDILIGPDKKRVELKTAVIATPKEGFPPDFFNKDILHLQTQGNEDPDCFPWEGALRENRKAEMAILVCDKSIATKSVELKNIFADINNDKTQTEELDGVSYLLKTGVYNNPATLIKGDKHQKLHSFVAILATPSQRQ